MKIYQKGQVSYVPSKHFANDFKNISLFTEVRYRNGKLGQKSLTQKKYKINITHVLEQIF